MSEKKSTILVVDDQPVNLKVLLSFLESHGFVVRLADTGERAIRSLEVMEPDLILLDVMMPGINGFETCKRIKANKDSADIPIIFMTALDSIEDKINGFDAGGVDYITKPFQKVEVLARVKTHVTLRNRERELQKALADVKELSGFLPICSFCKKIRDDEGYWQQVDKYITEHSDVLFSHGICEHCAEEHYGDILKGVSIEQYRERKK